VTFEHIFGFLVGLSAGALAMAWLLLVVIQVQS
jgi:hypothetical protein